ncbi:hypothetical protein F4801DRAFT_577935 [Xylaria longipes]|nr:hypothetical protein F4801DRAFT_577935 [Xylaria longipes]RYC56226.1 hypothetical protein CHU98_g9986 [Xylaria longipes]
MSSSPIFKDCVVSIAGDLDDYDWREEKVKQWVQYWGGAFSSIVDGNVTHLLCTRNNFKKKIADVRVALKSKNTKIVMRDWLEDSINKKLRLKTLPYQLDEEARQEEVKKRKIQKMQTYSKNAEDYVDERFWHIYRDRTYFQYQIQLKRDDKESGNVGEKHLLTLWESNAKPYNYRCTTLFTKKGKNKASRYPLNETPVDLKTGLKTFEKFFKKKAGITWEERIEKVGTTGLEHFQYQPPSGGKPVGLVKGRHASIFGGDGRIGAPNQISKKEQNKNGLAEDKRPDETHRKRAREHVADDTEINAEDGEHLAKKCRLEAAEAVSVPVETKAGSAKEVIAVDNNSDSGAESEEDIQGVQVHGEVLSDETPQDVDGENEVQYPPEFDNVINDGTLGPVDYYDEYQPENDQADGEGLAAPCNSEVGDEEVENENEIVDDDDGMVDDDDAEFNDAPRENTDQEAEDVSKMYDEVQHAEIEDDDEEGVYTHDDNDDDISCEAIRARRLAQTISAAAANIYYEGKRGVALVQDSQALLIDGVRAREAYIGARAKKIKEREAADDAEDAEDEMLDLGLDGSMDY